MPLLVLCLVGIGIPFLSWWGDSRLRNTTRLQEQAQTLHSQASVLRDHLAEPGTGPAPALATAIDRSLDRLTSGYRTGTGLTRFADTRQHLARLQRSWSNQLRPRLGGDLSAARLDRYLNRTDEAAAALARETTQLSAMLWASQAGLFLVGLVAAAVAVRRARRSLLQPLALLRHWAQRMRRGDLSARVPLPAGTREFTVLANDINQVGEELSQLKEDMEGRVQAQTEHLARKKASLEILYDVAASLNGSASLEELLSCFLDRLMSLLEARAGMVRLATGDGQMRLVASRGLSEEAIERERLIPEDRCLCGHALQAGELRFREDASKCAKNAGTDVACGGNRRMVVVPLRYRGRSLGVYNLFVEADPLNRLGDELNDLLESVGQHLGMAIEKSRLDQEARRLSIIEERTLLAGELHDSLAQNLASMRVAIKMLGKSVRDGETEQAQEDLEQVESGLEAANRSLRELMNSFRSRLDDRDLIPAIESHVERFRRETGILAHFLYTPHEVELDADGEVQAFHTVMEALANVRKHSGAEQAWVILEQEGDGYRLRVEDDGSGLGEDPPTAGSDEHFGLALMQERARRLGGSIRFEERPGGGARVVLSFPRRYRIETPSLSDEG